jgi:Propanediol dehydratase, small subunit
MAQHDYVISDQSFPAFRADVNTVLAAVVSQNSGPNQPAPTFAYQLWADTTAGIFKIRNAGNNGWISLYRLDGSFTYMPPEDGEVTTAKLADGALAASTAGWLKMADQFVTTAKLADGALAASTAGRLKMADQFVTLEKIADGALAASTAGRAKMADGFVTTAKLGDAQVAPGKLSQPLTRATAVATTSGTAVDFTGIPSWAKRITVMLDGVSTNGTAFPILQIGDSGGIESTGYVAIASVQTNVIQQSTASFVLDSTPLTAATTRQGLITLANVSGNTWVASGNIHSASSSFCSSCAGSKTLSATLDRIRLTTVNGTDTFDGGTINILWEG